MFITHLVAGTYLSFENLTHTNFYFVVPSDRETTCIHIAVIRLPVVAKTKRKDVLSSSR